jgi:iduronate 2-sulfatase
MNRLTLIALTRQTFLQGCAIGLVALIAGAARADDGTGPRRKNVLLIYVDDLRPEINCYGKSKIISPNIDKLAARSLVFNKAYCQVPICMPSRVSTLSGMYARSRGQGILRRLLPKGLPSLPGYFKANGYDTISIGKIYHFNEDDPESWTKRYTDTFLERQLVCDGFCSGYQLEENKNGLTYSKTGRNRSPLTECVDAPDNAYPDGATADKAVADLREYGKSGKPLFLAAGFYRPHLPWAAPKKYWDLYEREDIDLAKTPYFPKGAISRNSWGDLRHYGDEAVNAAASHRGDYTADTFPVLPEDKQRELIHGYWACVSFIDAQIGRILDTLDELGMAEDTVVVLCSDHGWQLGEHKLWSKCSNYEEAVRVPLMVAVPGITNGDKTDALTELVDLYPTLCELTGLAVPEHVEGISMAPLLETPSLPWKTAAFNIWGGARSMRTDRYRLTVYDKAMPKGNTYQLPGQGRYELYDYQADPAGNENIAVDPKNRELLDALIAQMNAGWKAARPSTK